MNKFDFKLVSPEQTLLEEEVTMVVIPGIEGNIGVLHNHAPTISTLRPGLVTVYQGNDVQMKVFIDGGVVEITPDRCTALVTEGTPIESLDKTSLEMEIKNLLEDVEDYQDLEEQKEAQLNLEIAQSKMVELLAHQDTTL